MSVTSLIVNVLMLAGSAVAVMAGIGVLKFKSPYARFHAAGKASPIAFLIAGLGASIELGWGGAARFGVVAASLLLTLPVAVHLLFRAVHRTSDVALKRDDLGR